MTKVLFRDLPGGPEFIQRCIAAAADMSLAFSGEPDDKVLAHLHATRDHFEAKLAGEIGADNAATVVDTLIKVVMAQKRKLEAGATGSA
jgi:hypothetical protein